MGEQADLLKLWNRDLSTCTAEELADRWDKEDRKAVARVDQFGFEHRIKDHNPIYFLAKRAWFSNRPDLLYPPLHRDQFCKFLLEHYMDNSKDFFGAILIAQRDSLKTTFTHRVFASFIPLRGKHLKDYDERVQLIHHKEKIASRNLVSLKQAFIVNPWFKTNWPEFCSDVDFGTKTEFDWPCKSPMGSEVPSIASTGLSASQVGAHFDWNLFTDPVTEKHRSSKQVRDEAKHNYTAYRYLLDTKTGKELIDGTPYHPNDLHAMNLNAKSKGKYLYKRLITPARDDKGVLNFPTRHTEEFLENIRQLEIAQTGTDLMYWLQYLCRNKPGDRGATNPDWIQCISMKELKKKQILRVLIVDPAWKGTETAGTGNYAAGGVMGFEQVEALVNRYLIDGFYSKELTALGGLEEMFRLMKIYGVSDVAVEEHGSHTFRNLLEEEARKRGIFMNLIELKSKNTPKANRIVSFLHHVESRHFYIVDECSVKKDFLDEYTDWVGPDSEVDNLLDVGGYSCDPNVTEICSPIFNTWQQGEVWTAYQEMPRRTRYCAL